MNNKIAIIIGLLSLASCQSQKDFNPTSVSLISECPKQVDCTIQILTGKSMLIQNDGNATTYTLQDATGTNVIIYKHNKIVKGDLQDAGYREEIVFEIDQKNGSLKLTDANLQTTKMLFGRFCFCKGQTGYYPVEQGTLSIGNDIADLNFIISQVPQITKKIQFSLK